MAIDTNGETTNFLLGAPNWADASAQVTARSIVTTGRDADRMQDRSLGRTWLSESMSVATSTVGVRFDEARASRAAALVGVTVPEEETWQRIRRGPGPVCDVIGHNNTLNGNHTVGTNITGSVDRDPWALPASGMSASTITSDWQSDFLLVEPNAGIPLATGARSQYVVFVFNSRVAPAEATDVTISVAPNGLAALATQTFSLYGNGASGLRYATLFLDGADIPARAIQADVLCEVGQFSTNNDVELLSVAWIVNYDQQAVGSVPVFNRVLANGITQTNGDTWVPQGDIYGRTASNPIHTPADNSVASSSQYTLKMPSLAGTAPGLESRIVVVARKAGGTADATMRFTLNDGFGPGGFINTWQTNNQIRQVDADGYVTASASFNALTEFPTPPVGGDYVLTIEITPNGTTSLEILSVGIVYLTTDTTVCPTYDSDWEDAFPTVPGTQLRTVVPSFFERRPQVTASHVYLDTHVIGAVAPEGQATERTDQFMRWDMSVTRDPMSPSSTLTPELANTRDMQVARVVDTPAVSLLRATDWQARVVDPSLAESTPFSNVTWWDLETPIKRVRVEMSQLDQASAVADLWDYIYRHQGNSLEVLLILWPENTNVARVMAVWGNLIGDNAIRSERATALMSSSFEVEETS